jgi:hypothetical protein
MPNSPAMRPAAGSIDSIDFLPLAGDATPGQVGDVLVVSGWAHQPGATPDFSLVVDETSEHAITSGIHRADVASALDDPSAVDSGFAASVSTIDLAEGDHAIAIVASAGGTRTEIARARFRLSAAEPLGHTERSRGWIDSWTDEDGRSEQIVGPSVRVPRHQVIRIDGWVADTIAESPAIAGFALIGDHVVQLAYGFERMDVARELGEGHAYCGFSASFPGGYASPEGTPVRLILLAGDGTTLRAGEPTIALIGYD